MLPSPLILDPVLVPKPWGGNRLHALGRHDDPVTPIGESWDVADLPADATTVRDPVSRIIGGHADGWSLGDLLEHDAGALLGDAATVDGRFPLLVKMLDAREALSVQVHPPVSLDPVRSKTESWIVLDAEPGAQNLLGVRPGITLDDVRRTIGTSDLLDLLQPVPARAGDVVHLPAGMIHALGAGVLVAEVQTPSDVTYRLWDWPDVRDGGRVLHVAAGLRAIAAGWTRNREVTAGPATNGRIVETDAYCLDRTTIGTGELLAASQHIGHARICIVLDGELRWQDPELGRRLRGRTQCTLLPAASGVRVLGGPDGATVLIAVPV